MTIETGPARSVARSTSRSESSHQGKKDAAAEGGLGGFMAAMAAVEAPATAMQQVAVTPATVSSVKDDGSSKIKTPSLIDAGGFGSDATVLLPDYVGTVEEDFSFPASSDSVVLHATDPAAAAAATAAAVLALFSQDPEVASDMPMDAAALLGQSVAWNGGAADGEQRLPGSTQALATGGVITAPRGGSALQSGMAPMLESPEVVGAQFADSLQQIAKGGMGTKPKLQVAVEPLAKVVTALDSKAVANNQRVVDISAGPMAIPMGASALVPIPQREEQPRERSVFRTTASDGSAVSLGGSSASPTTIVSAAPEVITSTESLIAEKVSYWVSNSVQNAEMKLDGFGELPVEVSIRMQGNEAHVSFRTDELQARAALENAGEQLKDLLQREGLVLSGVSVGTAGAGDSGAQERKSRQHARQSTVAALQPVLADAHPMSVRLTGAGLDLFV